MCCSFAADDELTAQGLDPLTRLKRVESLSLYCRLGTLEGYSPLSPKAFRRFGDLSLRQLVYPWNPGTEGLAAICSLPELEDLRLGRYRVDERNKMGNEALAPIRHLKKLRRLDLPDMGLTDAALRHIAPLRSLEVLNLKWNRMTDWGLEELKALRGLRGLMIDHLGQRGLRALKDLPNLDHLEVCEFDPGSGTADLSELKSLNSLEIGFVIGAPTARARLPENLRRLKLKYKVAVDLELQTCKQVEHVTLDVGRISVASKEMRDLEWLRRLPRLREVALEWAIDRDVAQLAGLSQLRAISLSGGCTGSLGNECVAALGNLQHVESFQIDGSRVTDLD